MTGFSQVTARVDANSRVGLGHLRRSRVLLDELARRGSSVGFLGYVDEHAAALPLHPMIRLSSSTSEQLDPVRDAEASVAALPAPGPGGSWVVVDHYGLGESWERIVSAAGHRILAIDDLRDRSHCAEILVSDTAEPFSTEIDRFPGGALQLLGSPYALLGPEFEAVEKTSSPPAAGLRLLVTFGGADPTGESFKVLEALRRNPGGASSGSGVGRIDLVIGPSCERREDLIQEGGALVGVQIHDAPSSLAPLMCAADLVVTAGGNSLVEALAIGRPCLVIQTAENQARMIRSLSKEGLILPLGDHAEVTVASITAGLSKLADLRLDLAARLSDGPVFDTRGASRIARAMEDRAVPRKVKLG